MDRLRPAALSAIAVAPPDAPVAHVAAEVERQFGLAGELAPLVSERDQNFRLTTADGRRFVAKVTSTLEDSLVTEFQIAALLHLEHTAALPLPRVVPTITGSSSGTIDVAGVSCRLRVVSFVEGTPLDELDLTPEIVTCFGAALAALDRGLVGFSHPGEQPVLLWDMQRTSDVRELLDYIDAAPSRRRVERVLDDFDARIVPTMSRLRAQVIHGDANPENVLQCADGIGFIDFGDMVNAPLVFEVAIAAAYLRSTEPLELLLPFVEGYHRVTPLLDEERALLFDLVRARLATSVALCYWRLRERNADDDYRNKLLTTDQSTLQFLAALDDLGREGFAAALAQL